MAQYGRKEYWDERYTRDPEPFDWYQKWDAVKEPLAKYLKASQQILNIGAGNSRLSEEMFDAGFQNITNIDISGVVVKAMTEKYADRGGMTYAIMNVMSLHFSDGKFDVVLDKATLDSLLCGDNSTVNADKTLSEIARVLKPGGFFICISHAKPESRLLFLEKPKYNWTVSHMTIPKPTAPGVQHEDPESPPHHFIYVATKKE
eukprot:TRINITY_DN5195_c0_g1_i1.p1 TRINITY_DN5195_c0_g1~~TRINITY_DN5195_c0_g1_i1.p1  ORF type:complete len:203 (-),score=47.31 TRINITY_DN5195_c0_g1_i1:36-644(-)